MDQQRHGGGGRRPRPAIVTSMLTYLQYFAYAPLQTSDFFR